VTTPVSRLRVHTAQSIAVDERDAVAEIRAGLDAVTASAILLFCSTRYDLERLAHEIRSAFSVPVFGCTSAGQIGPAGFQKGGITALSLTSDELRVTPYVIRPLGDCETLAALRAAEAVRHLSGSATGKGFGLILVDGLSFAEERLMSALYHGLGDVPLIGGSAGDDLSFERTFVFTGRDFESDAALFLLFETSLPFTTFKLQHVRATDEKLVVTLADPARRIVYEINGEPAAEAYAELVGVPVDALDARVFSANPVVLTLSGDDYVHSIQRVNPDLSLTFFCAMEEGLVLSLGETVDVGASLQHAFCRVAERVGRPEVVLGCDCILRRLEFEQNGVDEAVGRFFARHRVVGFSTYGEQYNAIHVNQTFTGVAISSGEP